MSGKEYINRGKECSVSWCDRPAKGLGLCSSHHTRLLMGRDLEKPWRKSSGMKCSASPTCQRTGRRGHQGMCERHHAVHMRKREATGDWAGYMPASIVNEHIEMLRASGMGLTRIAKVAGLSISGVLLLAKRQKVWRTHGEKILALQPIGFDECESSGYVPALGSIRRIQALIALGFTQKEISIAIGRTPTWCSNLFLRNTKVQIATARKVDEVYREWRLKTPAPSNAASACRSRAKARGWPTPDQWNIDEIDDPNAQPHKVEKLSAGDRIREYRELGYTDDEMAHAMGITIASVRQAMLRHGIPIGRRYRDIEDHIVASSSIYGGA